LIHFTEKDTRAELAFEPGGPRPIAMIINGDDCRWTAPEARSMSRDEVVRLVTELARSMGARIVLVFPDGEQMIE